MIKESCFVFFGLFLFFDFLVSDDEHGLVMVLGYGLDF
jgi:hypothetical protein